MFEGIGELFSVVGPIAKHPVYWVLLAAVLLDLVEEWDEHPVVRHRLVGDLQTGDLVGFDIDHGMHLDPAAPDPPLLAHPLPRFVTLIPGTVDGDMTSSAKISGVTLSERSRRWIRQKRVV